MSRFLIARFSAIGDVAMTLPVVYSVAESNPSDEFLFITTPFLSKLFHNPPSNLSVVPFDISGGNGNIFNVYKRINNLILEKKIDIFIDLHNVIRTMAIWLACRKRGIKIYRIDKGRSEKKRLAQNKNKIKTQLKFTTERYADTFKSAGLKFRMSFSSIFGCNEIVEWKKKQNPDWFKFEAIGFAPFAKHKGKMYPIENMEKVISYFASLNKYNIFLFGSKGAEAEILSVISQKYDNVFSVAGKYQLIDELFLIACLSLMVSMDSANMHFASLVSTKVVSVWGTTHPYAGFLGFNQDISNAVLLDLSCQPCSIYGKTKCFTNDFACMNTLAPEKIISQIKKALN